MCGCFLRYSLELGREEEETEKRRLLCGCPLRYSLELGREEEEETEMKTTMWLSSSILSGIG
jgi:hypothetical protein